MRPMGETACALWGESHEMCKSRLLTFVFLTVELGSHSGEYGWRVQKGREKTLLWSRFWTFHRAHGDSRDDRGVLSRHLWAGAATERRRGEGAWEHIFQERLPVIGGGRGVLHHVALQAG